MSDREPEFDGLTRLQRKVIDAAVDIMEAEVDRPEFMHSVLCQVGLPRSKTDARTFERSNGRASMMVEAGRLWRRGKWVDQPLPYGAKPRLILVHACSEAVRTRSLEINIGRSVHDFMSRLGLDSSGHEYPRFRAQVEALAACRMLLGISSDTKDVTISTQPFSRFEAWMQTDGKSLGLWPGSLTLSSEFFGTLLDHAVPLDPRAISALQKSALALDVYSWLAHRLCRIRKADGIMVSWGNLRQQFGQEYACSKDFKKEFRAALIKVRAVYPDARISDVIGGLILHPSAPPVPKSSTVVKLPPGISSRS